MPCSPGFPEAARSGEANNYSYLSSRVLLGGMNPTRLFVLGALAKRGPMYGHQLRRGARLDRADLWSDVRPGSLYGALHRLAAEGLIEALRTEQAGLPRPARSMRSPARAAAS